MTALGLCSKKGRKLNLHVFLKMLRNPVYVGEMKSQKWGTQKGLHDPIICPHVFRNVQLILSGKKPIAAPYKRNREDFPLRRFLRCVKCGKPLTGGPQGARTESSMIITAAITAAPSNRFPLTRPQRNLWDCWGGFELMPCFSRNSLPF